MTDSVMPLAGNPLHRAGNERRDPAWLAAALADERTRFLPVHGLKVPVDESGGGAGAGRAGTSGTAAPNGGPAPGGSDSRCGPRDAGAVRSREVDAVRRTDAGDGGGSAEHHSEDRRPPLLPEDGTRRLAWAPAGDWLAGAGEPILLGTQGGAARFAADVSGLPEPAAIRGFRAGVEFQGLRTAAPNLPAAEAAIAAQARGLVGWHERHPFCAACGGKTRSRNGGSSRSCASCRTEHFPRTDPVVIVVVSRRGRALLGRSGRFPGNLYSALAGFMEAGESVEETVRREVAEEAGVRVGAVRYVASQPWPFPASLMLGCLAEGLSDEITIDAEELEDARWFSRAEIIDALAGRNDALRVPQPIAIAHHLIRAWLAE